MEYLLSHYGGSNIVFDEKLGTLNKCLDHVPENNPSNRQLDVWKQFLNYVQDDRQNVISNIVKLKKMKEEIIRNLDKDRINAKHWLKQRELFGEYLYDLYVAKGVAKFGDTYQFNTEFKLLKAIIKDNVFYEQLWKRYKVVSDDDKRNNFKKYINKTGQIIENLHSKKLTDRSRFIEFCKATNQLQNSHGPEVDVSPLNDFKYVPHHMYKLEKIPTKDANEEKHNKDKLDKIDEFAVSTKFLGVGTFNQ